MELKEVAELISYRIERRGRNKERGSGISRLISYRIESQWVFSLSFYEDIQLISYRIERDILICLPLHLLIS